MWVANCSSWPCGVTNRSLGISPALCTRPSRAGTRLPNSVVQAATASRSETSHTSPITSEPGTSAVMPATVRRTFSGLRPSTWTVAPSPAKARAISRPIPAVAPVTRTRLPTMESGAGSAGHQCLRRPEPILV